MASVSFGRQDVLFSTTTLDAPSLTLTSSYVASLPISLKFVKKFTVYGFYTPGAGGTGNSLDYEVQINPFYPDQDPGNLYWAPVGKFTDTTGTWTEEPGTFHSAAGVASTQKNLTPLDVVDPSAAQVRILVKEDGGAGTPGVVRLMLGTNTIN